MKRRRHDRAEIDRGGRRDRARRAAAWSARSSPIRDGGFAVRALTRKVDRTRRARWPRQARRSCGRPRRRREPEARVRRARTARSASPTTGSTSRPRRSSPRPRNLAQAAKAAGVQPRDLVDAGGHAAAGCRSTTTACRRCMGKYKVPHFDAKGEAERVLPRLGVPTTFLLTSFYWDNLIYFGMGPKPGRTASSRSRCPWATRSCPASRPRTSASAPTASSSAATSSSARRSASRAST